MGNKPIKSPALRLQAGGTLRPDKHLYIKRDADYQLLDLLIDHEYVNVLTSRQMGKSSLMISTIHELEKQGIEWVSIDVAAQLDNAQSLNEFYLGFLGTIKRQLDLGLDLIAWWEQDGTETASQKLLRFFEDVVGQTLKQPLVIFLDEIDATLKLDFTDHFFTAIRGMYNERSLVTAYQTISFCLLGVATPDALIKERRITAYNIGTTLELRDFDPQKDDVTALRKALNSDSRKAEELLKRLLHWTGGHPYLTQRFCEEIVSQSIEEADALDQLMESNFDSLNRVRDDVHFDAILRFIKDRLTDENTSLKLYRKLLNGKVVADQTTLAHAELKLSGLVKRDAEGNLNIRNPIYRQLFGESWLKSLPSQRKEQFYRRGFALVSGIIIVLVAIGGFLAVEQIRIEKARNSLTERGIVFSDDGEGETIDFPDNAPQEMLTFSLGDIKILNDEIHNLDLGGTQISDISALSDLIALQSLTLWNTQISDISALSGLIGLQTLDLEGTKISDISALSGLIALRNLDLEGTQISDISALNGLIALQRLTLGGTQITDISALSDLIALQSLTLEGTQISDVSALSGLVALQRLTLGGTQISDISALSGLIALRSLDLEGTQISDISALSDLIALRSLTLWNTQISDIRALSGLIALQSLDLEGTQISDISALSDLIALQSLALEGTQISNISALNGLIALQSLYLGGTQISDISALSGLIALRSLDLGGTQISDISALGGLIGLQRLYLGGTKISDISALSGLVALQSLTLGGTKISDISALSGLVALRSLTLGGTQVDKESINALRAQNPKLNPALSR
ncbi:MAG: hypothetical protein GKR95_01190 [Gammaproteobacteria bacterium]|nr:hypothetical protein [Gammaproteobacteria bacterium]